MVIKNVKIFVSEKKTIEKGFIVIRNGFIEKVDDMQNFEEKKYYEEDVKDFEGLAIYPGFIDAHSHIGMWETALNFEGADGNEETDPITPNFRAIDAVNPLDDAFKEAVKAGITTVVVGPGSANPIGGSIVAMKTFGDCVDEMIIKNPVGIKFALGENPKTAYNEKEMTPTTRMGVAALIREQLEKTKRYIEKLKEEEKPEYDAKCEALIDLLKRKIKAFFHCHRADDIFTAIRISKEFGLDYTLVHATEGHLIAKKLKEKNVVVGPIISDISKPELKNYSDENAAILNLHKVNVAICSDAPVLPIQYLSLSCAIAIKNGLSKEDAILAITKNAAIAAGIFDLVGSIEVGKIANFVLFKKGEDIFSPYSSSKYVIIDGKIVYEKN